ncbi:Mu transposase C-terminal domain-containing protein [Roseibium sp.]|uniref:Mu transposase C-terminal domain-containing protein n=1 Tax=Roseibium sp. TaxID=1936156 RepID=UPI003B50BDAE
MLAEDLGKHLVRYIVDTYHNTAHSGLSWQTPNEAWEDLSSRYVVKPPPGRIRRQLVFGFSDNRRIQNRGIRFMGLFYRSAELSRLRMDVGQDDVRVRVDLEDLGAVFVSENIPHAPWFRVPCDFEFMNGVPAAHWYEAASALRRKYKAGAKLAESIVIASLQDVRQAGRHSAAQRGIGPSTVTREEIERQETEIVSHYNFRIAQERGQALEGMDEEPGVEAATEDSFVGDTSDPEASVEVVEEAENESPPEPRLERRRGRFRKDFLGED